MRVKFKKFLVITLAICLLIIGAVGALLPVVHGTVFVLLGLCLLALEMPSIEKKLESVVVKNKKIDKMYNKIMKYLRSKFY